MKHFSVRTAVWTAVAWATCAAAASPAHAQQVAATNAAERPIAADALFERLVTVKFERVSLKQAIDILTASAHAHAAYQGELVGSVRKSVTLHATRISLGSAFEMVLAGTGLRAQAIDADLIKIEPSAKDAKAGTGIIAGRVIDVATKRAVPGVLVTVDNAKNGVQSENDGTFRVADVAVGSHRVVFRRLGYEVYRAVAEVKEGETTTLSIALTGAASRLTDVVTTATGQQRRLEVGTVIAHLNVDSIVKTAPVMSLTDLLAARVPSVQVIQRSGLVGAGPAIRIRGQSSLIVAGDPIIIVDGVRMDNTPGGAYNNNYGAYNSPSRLNDLDFKQIETIDILKGPAASTEYGTDAANGVIVVTTKRGQAGPTRWNGSATHGWSEIPTHFPDFWWAFGHTPTGVVRHCKLLDVAANTCQIDSVVHDNPFNHDETTIYGSGPSQSYHASVAGGSQVARYFIGATTSDQIGTTHLPAVFKPMAQSLGFPSSVNDPNSQQQHAIDANLNINLHSGADLTVTSKYMSVRQMEPAGSGLTPSATNGPVVLDSAHSYGYGTGTQSPLGIFNGGQSEATDRTTVGFALDLRPASWLSGHVSGGTDRGTHHRITLQTQAAAQFWQSGYPSALGTMQVDDQVVTVTSGDARLAAAIPVRPAVRWTSAVGLNMSKTAVRGMNAVNYNLTRANPTFNGTPNTYVTQVGNSTITAGAYVDEQIAIADQLFLATALRLDGASGFGDDARTTAYPKFNASWVMLNTDATTIRLRAAFGVAGVQPANGASAQQFQAGTAPVNGVQTSVSNLTSPGNPILRPERTREWEGGVDLGLFHNRLNIELSSYTKRTTDALVPLDLGLTFNGFTMQQNLGNVHNGGIEGSVNATLVNTTGTIWSVTVNASHNTNKLVTIAPGVTQNQLNGYPKYVVGYPVYGYWGKHVAYADTNGNHIVEIPELIVDSADQFFGSSMPKAEVSYSSSLSIFRGRLVVNTGFDSKFGDVVSIRPNTSPGSLQAQNDLHASLYSQAQVLAAQRYSSGNSLNFEKGSFVAWRDLSVTYNLPVKWVRAFRASDFSVTASVANLAKWTRYTGLDPEVNDVSFYGNALQPGANYGDARSTTSNSAVPIPRTWMLSANVGF